MAKKGVAKAKDAQASGLGGFREQSLMGIFVGGTIISLLRTVYQGESPKAQGLGLRHPPEHRKERLL